jgi:hypothetical protein
MKKSNVEQYLQSLQPTEFNYLSSAAERALILMTLEPDNSQLRPVLEALRPMLEAMQRDGLVYAAPMKPNGVKYISVR